MAEETLYTAKNGVVVISTANSNLDGTGTMSTLLSGGANGTLLKSAYVKAQTNTSEGMIRFFITGGGNTRLIREVPVQAVTKGANDPAFEAKVDLNFSLQSGYELKVSTQNADTFGVVVDAMEWSYYGSSVRSDTTEYTCYNGLTNMSTANTNLDGTGTIELVYLYNNTYGVSIESICIKAIVSTTPGMVRLYLQDDNAMMPTIALFKEIPVPAITKSGKVNAFEHTIVFEDDFELQTGWSLYASTEKGEAFRIMTVGQARTYAA
jgi:hypothetical protein